MQLQSEGHLNWERSKTSEASRMNWTNFLISDSNDKLGSRNWFLIEGKVLTCHLPSCHPWNFQGQAWVLRSSSHAYESSHHSWKRVIADIFLLPYQHTQYIGAQLPALQQPAHRTYNMKLCGTSCNPSLFSLCSPEKNESVGRQTSRILTRL